MLPGERNCGPGTFVDSVHFGPHSEAWYNSIEALQLFTKHRNQRLWWYKTSSWYFGAGLENTQTLELIPSLACISIWKPSRRVDYYFNNYENLENLISLVWLGVPHESRLAYT